MISKRLRYEVLRRDNHACRYCGRTAPEVKLTVDHVVPVTLGGSDDPTNLVTACADCNAGKTSTTPDAPLVADVEQDALRWALAMERAAEMRAADHFGRDTYVRWVDEHWLTWSIHGDPFPRPPGWHVAVWRFWELHVPMSELRDCIDRAMANNRVSIDQTWRYFLGVVWRRRDEQLETATRLLDEEEGSHGP